MSSARALFPTMLVALLLTASCKPKVPGKYIQPGRMEDILYDYHVATAMATVQGESREDEEYLTELYRQAALRKHGVTREELDSSLVYYTRHGERLHKIYENISERLGASAMALGASASEIANLGDMALAGDTASVWAGASSYVLADEAPCNVATFEVDVDTTYHAGDKIILSFDSKFLARDNGRTGTALLAMRLGNDSVASRSTTVSLNRTNTITIADDRHKGIKGIRGFFYLNRPRRGRDAGDGQAVRALFIDNIRMVRMHERAKEEEAPLVAPPGTARDAGTDSLASRADAVAADTAGTARDSVGGGGARDKGAGGVKASGPAGPESGKQASRMQPTAPGDGAATK